MCIRDSPGSAGLRRSERAKKRKKISTPPDSDKGTGSQGDKFIKKSRPHLPFPETPEMATSHGKNPTTGQQRQGGAAAGSASPSPGVPPPPPGTGVSQEAAMLAKLVERMDGMAKVIGQVDGMEGRLVGKIDTRMDDLEKKVDNKIGASMAKVCLLYTSPSPRD